MKNHKIRNFIFFIKTAQYLILMSL